MTQNDVVKVAVVGLGYFSQFHLDAWASQPGLRLVALADSDPVRAKAAATAYGARAWSDPAGMLQDADPDIVDLVVPPQAQAALIRAALKPGRWIICQKPFCTSLQEAESVTAEAEAAGVTLVIHENFRFQPWYRTIRRFLDSGQMGQVWNAAFRLRPGDGRGPDAYLARQPGFQRMERFLIQETAVHLIDTFQWLFGPIESVFADLRRLNPAIAGEDAAIVILAHRGGPRSLFDGNRLADHPGKDPRRTMGEMLIEGEAGALSLDGDGQVWFRPFGARQSQPVRIEDPVDPDSFGGGCVAALIRHVLEARRSGTTPENTARDYLSVVRVVEAAYLSAQTGTLVRLDH